MTGDPNGASTSSAWRNVFRWACLVSAGVVLLAAIAFSRASSQAGPGSRGTPRASYAAADAGELNTLVLAGPTPTPLPCPLCLQQLTFSENFDGVVPPALPLGWLATNAQVHRRFGSHLIPEFPCRQPIHLQMPRSLTTLPCLAINDSIRPGSLFLRAAEYV